MKGEVCVHLLCIYVFLCVLNSKVATILFSEAETKGHGSALPHIQPRPTAKLVHMFSIFIFFPSKMASWLSGLIVAAKALHTLGSIPFVA